MNTTAPRLQPLHATDRIVVMDILRGVALLGILLMNIEAFAGPLDLSFTGIDPRWHGLDYAADALVYVLVQGKFFLLFSLLFGAGFAVMAERADQAGRPFTALYVRRSIGLLIIGVCHAVLVWSGDILMLYAVLSLLLLACRGLPVAWLPVMGLLCFAASVLLSLVFALLVWVAATSGSSALDSATPMQMAQQAVEAQRAAYGSGSWREATGQRLEDIGRMLGGVLITGPEVFGMFLVGAWFARSGALARPETFRRMYARLRWIALPSGLVLMGISALWLPYMAPGRFTTTTGLAYALAAVASLLMSLGYLAWIVHLRRSLTALAAPGRMALTNYLLQSVVCTGIFYGYGLGFFEALPRVWQLPFALGLFALQAVLSQRWLAHFHFGPVEWVWRALTYLRWPPLRRAHRCG